MAHSLPNCYPLTCQPDESDESSSPGAGAPWEEGQGHVWLECLLPDEAAELAAPAHAEALALPRGLTEYPRVAPFNGALYIGHFLTLYHIVSI